MKCAAENATINNSHADKLAAKLRKFNAYATNQAADAIDTILSELEAREADRRRLDFLDQMNLALNKHYGTQYRWSLILSPNIVRLMSGWQNRGYVGDIDLNDANSGPGSFESCRKAIDAALAQRQEGEEK